MNLLCLKILHCCMSSMLKYRYLLHHTFFLRHPGYNIHFLVVHESSLTHHSSHDHSFSYVWHTGLKLNTQLDKGCTYSVWKYHVAVLYHSQNIDNLLHPTFFLTHIIHICSLTGLWTKVQAPRKWWDSGTMSQNVANGCTSSFIYN